MTAITAEEIARLKELYAQSSAGKWFTVGDPWGDESFAVAGGEDPHGRQPVLQLVPVDEVTEDDDGNVPEDWDEQGKADLTCAVAARNALPRLLDEIERLKKIEEAAKKHGDCFNKCPICDALYGKDKP